MRSKGFWYGNRANRIRMFKRDRKGAPRSFRYREAAHLVQEERDELLSPQFDELTDREMDSVKESIGVRGARRPHSE